ncbi:hypothetical protein MsAg5_10440 [Methanosarcinaceae archaeon Ag5]|uniref:DUF7847 domain-containing protein n=1 Tax=Methanolapillus africanus TaxID=3028297 RepID=A0AAE4MJM3_9EURY|nr:hypothetical protein [Methanosarcinaceae archaeon Ag5]
MSENLMDTLSKGFSHFSKNPILWAPILLMFGVMFIVLFALIIVLTLAFGIAFSSVGLGEMSLYLILVLILSGIVVLAVTSYFSAGLTGMCKEIEVSGKTSFSDLAKYGNKAWVRVFLSTLLMAVISAVSIIFMIPAIVSLANAGITNQMWLDAMNASIAGNPLAFEQIATTAVEAAAFSFIGGLLLMLVYMLIVMFVFYFMEYAIVIDDLSVTAGIKKSWELLKTRAGDVIVFIIVVSVISWLISMVSYFIAEILAASVILSLIGMLVTLILDIAIIILTTIWAVRKYLVLTEQPLHEEEDLLSY